MDYFEFSEKKTSPKRDAEKPVAFDVVDWPDTVVTEGTVVNEDQLLILDLARSA